MTGFATAAAAATTTTATATTGTLGGFGKRDGHQTCRGEDSRDCAHFVHLDLLLGSFGAGVWHTSDARRMPSNGYATDQTLG
jgi:hypothetical protein